MKSLRKSETEFEFGNHVFLVEWQPIEDPESSLGMSYQDEQLYVYMNDEWYPIEEIPKELEEPIYSAISDYYTNNQK